MKDLLSLKLVENNATSMCSLFEDTFGLTTSFSLGE